MMHLAYRGLGGRYTTYLQERVRRVNRVRRMELTPHRPGRPGFKVAISAQGVPLTPEHLRRILEREEVTFFLGDSTGLPEEIVRDADCVVSVSSLPVSHQIEATIVTEQIEKCVLG